MALSTGDKGTPTGYGPLGGRRRVNRQFFGWRWLLFIAAAPMAATSPSIGFCCNLESTKPMFEVQTYLDPNGQDPYTRWVAALADRQARARVLVRVGRMAAGNFGDCKPVTEGVWELRIDLGSGYRVYYPQVGKRLVLLLAGGDKRTQQADITAAVTHWHDWQQRRTPT